jgi:hypothetical protein
MSSGVSPAQPMHHHSCVFSLVMGRCDYRRAASGIIVAEVGRR